MTYLFIVSGTDLEYTDFVLKMSCLMMLYRSIYKIKITGIKYKLKINQK